MADLQKVIEGMECCIISDEESECPDACPYYDECWKDECWKDESWKDEFVIGLALRKDALELLKAYKRRRALEGHNISNVDIPYGVTEAQFYAVMNNVVAALEHTDRGESWPYDEEGGVG